MKFSICKENRQFSITVPTALVLNPLTAFIFSRKLSRGGKGNAVSARALRVLFRAARREKRRYREWVLVDVKTADRTAVQVKL